MVRSWYMYVADSTRLLRRASSLKNGPTRPTPGVITCSITQGRQINKWHGEQDTHSFAYGCREEVVQNPTLPLQVSGSRYDMQRLHVGTLLILFSTSFAISCELASRSLHLFVPEADGLRPQLDKPSYCNGIVASKERLGGGPGCLLVSITSKAEVMNFACFEISLHLFVPEADGLQPRCLPSDKPSCCNGIGASI